MFTEPLSDHHHHQQQPVLRSSTQMFCCSQISTQWLCETLQITGFRATGHKTAPHYKMCEFLSLLKGQTIIKVTHQAGTEVKRSLNLTLSVSVCSDI